MYIPAVMAFRLSSVDALSPHYFKVTVMPTVFTPSKRRLLLRLTVLVVVFLLLGCSRYDAEVGYYEGESEKWDIWGDFSSLEECRDAAIARYNYYYRQGRAFTWSCLKKNNGGYESRHR